MTKKILIVDDDVSILKAIEILLKNAGYTVECLSNGIDVEEKVKSFEPRLIFLDMMLAGMDGRDIAKHLHQKHLIDSTSIVAISANHYMEKDINHYGISSFIQKPFETRYLLEMAKKYTE